MALGTPTLSLIGAVGAALTLGARRGGVLLSLLVLPLYIPVLIFGVAACRGGDRRASPRGRICCCSAALLVAGGCRWRLLPQRPAMRQALE